MLMIFTPVKIQRLRPGLNPRTWVPEASMLTNRLPKPSVSHINGITASDVRLYSNSERGGLKVQRSQLV